MSSSQSLNCFKNHCKTSSTLQHVLTEFTLAFTLEEPTTDAVDFAVKYFTGLQETRKRHTVQFDLLSTENESFRPMCPLQLGGRRQSMVSESYNPTSDSEMEDDDVVYPKTDAQRSFMTAALKRILLFRHIDTDTLNKIIDTLFERNVCAGEKIMNQNDEANYFYLIENGRYKVYRNGRAIKCLRAGSFGELALMYNQPRTYTVIAITDGKLWALDRQTFRRIVVNSAYHKRKTFEAQLIRVPMLNTLSKYERTKLADALETKRYRADECIYKHGSPANGMYFMEKGTVSIRYEKSDGETVVITKCGKDTFFGEWALVMDCERVVSAVAIDAVKAAFLGVDAFTRHLGHCTDIMKRKAVCMQGQIDMLRDKCGGDERLENQIKNLIS